MSGVVFHAYIIRRKVCIDHFDGHCSLGNINQQNIPVTRASTSVTLTHGSTLRLASEAMFEVAPKIRSDSGCNEQTQILF